MQIHATIPSYPSANFHIHSSSSMRAQALAHTTHSTHSMLLHHPSQLWPCQRMCRCMPPAPVAAAPSTSCGSVNTRNSRRGVLTAAATQPPTPTNDNEEQQQGGSSSQPGRQQQSRANTNNSSSSNSRKRAPPTTSSSSSTLSPFSIDDPQLLVGDCVALTAAALYRQIAAIVLSPAFPGWLAPLSFNPLRFAEFANFAGMLVASWVVAATLTGGYSGAAVGAGVPGALRAACKAWLVAMPICAAHLVLVTASESQALVGDSGFADVLPLAAAGPGEPLGTAAAVLGLMAMWRSFYAVYLDSWVWASARDVAEDAARFREALASVALVAAGCSVLLQVLQLTAVLSGAAADGVDVGQMLLSQLVA